MIWFSKWVKILSLEILEEYIVKAKKISTFITDVAKISDDENYDEPIEKDSRRIFSKKVFSFHRLLG